MNIPGLSTWAALLDIAVFDRVNFDCRHKYEKISLSFKKTSGNIICIDAQGEEINPNF